jgi:two-component system cell cycle sensor histidine kinase/response regulator CckA
MASDSRPPAAGDGAPTAIILVVDDDPAVLEVAARVLERAGYSVLQAANGLEAVAMARSHQGRLDLVLTDVVMPGMNGRELGELMGRERPETRLLYMSAYTEDEVILRGVSVAGMNFVYKPFTLDGLAEAVRRALSR